jgi:hypothetical protein
MIRSSKFVAAVAAFSVGLGAVSPALADGWGPPGGGPGGPEWRHPGWGGPPPEPHHHHDHGGDAALGVGLGILGLGVVAALASRPVIYEAPPPGYTLQPSGPVYAQPMSDTYIATDGRQCREYQTTIVVDGQPQGAYGTACLDASGTWRIVR